MNMITEQEIEDALQSFEQMSDDAIDREVELFTKEQEILFAYIMTIDEDLNMDERQTMLMIAIQIWAILKKHMSSNTNSVSAELLDEIDEANEQLLEQFSYENDDTSTNIERLLAQHKQPHLLDLVLAYLYEEIEESGLSQESTGSIFMYLLNFSDALIASVQEKSNKINE